MREINNDELEKFMKFDSTLKISNVIHSLSLTFDDPEIMEYDRNIANYVLY